MNGGGPPTDYELGYGRGYQDGVRQEQANQKARAAKLADRIDEIVENMKGAKPPPDRTGIQVGRRFRFRWWE